MAPKYSDMRDAHALAAIRSWDNVCFHCHQAAEKYLKAIICYNGENAPRTHNLEELCGVVSNLGVEMPTWITLSAATLSGLDVMAGYPGFDAAEVNAQQAGINARKIVSYALDYFKDRNMDEMNVFHKDPE